MLFHDATLYEDNPMMMPTATDFLTPKPNLAPTPHDVLFQDSTARLLRFRPRNPAPNTLPVLLVPSLINRWYILDLRPGASVASAFVDAGLDTYLLDWGIPHAEDRHLTWDDVMKRLHRFVRATLRHTGTSRIGLLGYCLGSTLTGIHTALHPDNIAALINLAGPFDFSKGGRLTEMTDPDWFDPEAIASAGNVAPTQMQSAFVALRPTAHVAKWVTLAQRYKDPDFRTAFGALEAWANDNIPFPAAAYITYIRELYQQNQLVQGTHHVLGRRVDLARLTCPVLTVGASRDTICPQPAALGLNEHCGSDDTSVVTVPGGHVGSVVGSRAAAELYPAMTEWLLDRLHVEPAKPAAKKASQSKAKKTPKAKTKKTSTQPADLSAASKTK